MFDPIVYRSKSGVVVEISIHGESIKFNIKETPGDPSGKSFPITWEDWEILVNTLKAQKP